MSGPAICPDTSYKGIIMGKSRERSIMRLGYAWEEAK
jgi:hypothetical protein